jgi:4'-phosphopantetheinyl transferase
MRLDFPSIITPVQLPPFKLWSGCDSDRFPGESVMTCWKEYDIITFLADFGEYETPDTTILDDREKERERTFKTDHFKKRFIVSRIILKQILKQIVGKEIGSNIVLGQENNGRVILQGRTDIHISLSYSGTSIALTLGKKKVGSDIELIRPLTMRKIQSCSFFEKKSGDEKELTLYYLQQWTMMEAYAKLRDMNLYPIIRERYWLKDTHFISYLINEQSVLSIASGSPTDNSALFRIIPEGPIPGSLREVKVVGKSVIFNGDIHARS